MFCPKCGKENENEANFCGSCGTNFTAFLQFQQKTEALGEEKPEKNPEMEKEPEKSKSIWPGLSVMVICLGFLVAVILLFPSAYQVGGWAPSMFFVIAVLCCGIVYWVVFKWFFTEF